MESGFSHKQRAIQTISNIFQIVQLAQNISKDDKQHFLRITLWRNIGKLYGLLCYTSQNNEGTQRKDYLIFEDYREIQPMF